MATVRHEIEKIFLSQRDRLRNADDPHMMRPKNNRKPLKGVARLLYLERKVKLSKAEEVASAGLGLAHMKVPTTPAKKKEKENEET